MPPAAPAAERGRRAARSDSCRPARRMSRHAAIDRIVPFCRHPDLHRDDGVQEWGLSSDRALAARVGSAAPQAAVGSSVVAHGSAGSCAAEVLLSHDVLGPAAGTSPGSGRFGRRNFGGCCRARLRPPRRRLLRRRLRRSGESIPEGHLPKSVRLVPERRHARGRLPA